MWCRGSFRLPSRVPLGIPERSWRICTREASKRAWNQEALIHCYSQVTQKDSRKKLNQGRASGQQKSYKLQTCEQEMIQDREIISHHHLDLVKEVLHCSGLPFLVI